MATSAFKSKTKRSSLGADDASSSTRPSRSFSRVPSPEPPSRGRFLNTATGSGFPQLTPDLKEDEKRSPSSARRRSATTPSPTPAPASASASQRRSRSVSRSHHRDHHHLDGYGSRKTTSSSTLGARRRSGSVSSIARYQFSDSESEEHCHKSSQHTNAKNISSWNYTKPSLHRPVTSSQYRVMRRSLREKESSKSCDGYSSHSSALTDEEAWETHTNEARRTVRAVHPLKKTEHDGVETGLYEVMRQELRHAVKDIRTEIKQGIMNVGRSDLDKDDSSQSNNSDVLQAVSVIRKNYTAKLEQSEKRKQDLLAEIVAEEQRGRELSKIVQELLPDTKDTTVQEKSFGRKNNDRSWMSKCLTEDAEKYFDDFLSNVEDTDISSFDGERSDASSAIGVKKQRDLVQLGEAETAGFSAKSSSLPAGMDDVVLPWLQWETSSDGTPLFYRSKVEIPSTPKDNACDLPQGESTASSGSNLFMSCSRPGDSSLPSPCGDDIKRFAKHENYICETPDRGSIRSYFNMDEYANIECSEENIFEAWKQRQGISSGALLLCSRSCLHL